MEEKIKNLSLGLSPNFGDHFAMQEYYNSLPAEVLRDVAARHYEARQSDIAVNDKVK